MTTVYIPTPVSEPPHKEEFYFCIDTDGDSRYLRYDPYLGIWDNDVTPITHWLKPIPVSTDSPVQRAIDYFEDCMEAMGTKDIEYKMLEDVNDKLKEFLPQDIARSAHIKQLEQEVQRLKGLLKTVFDLGRNNRLRRSHDKVWEQFKQGNNL